MNVHPLIGEKGIQKGRVELFFEGMNKDNSGVNALFSFDGHYEPLSLCEFRFFRYISEGVWLIVAITDGIKVKLDGKIKLDYFPVTISELIRDNPNAQIKVEFVKKIKKKREVIATYIGVYSALPSEVFLQDAGGK